MKGKVYKRHNNTRATDSTYAKKQKNTRPPQKGAKGITKERKKL